VCLLTGSVNWSRQGLTRLARVPQQGVWACQQTFRRLVGQLQAASGQAKACVRHCEAVRDYFAAGGPNLGEPKGRVMNHPLRDKRVAC
jgi:hypothetical protein